MSVNVSIVEDQRMMLDLIGSWIGEMEGYCVLSESLDGESGLSAIREGKPDIVILDIELPDYSGLDLITEVMHLNPQCRILVLTNHVNSYIVYRLKRLGVMGVLGKGRTRMVELKEALEALREWRLYYSVEVEETFRSVMQAPFSFFKILTPREQEMLRLFGLGWTNRDIAARMGLSESTIQGHRRNVMGKMDIKNTPDLMCYALMEGFVSEEKIRRYRSSELGIRNDG